MKKTNRRLSALFCAVLVIIVVVIATTPSVSYGQGAVAIANTSIQVGLSLGPATHTVQSASDFSYALLNGLSDYGLYHSIPDGSSVNITNIFSDNNTGTRMCYTLAVTSSIPFTVGSIGLNFTNKFWDFDGTLGDLGISLTKTGTGYGVDGQIYTSDNADTPLYALYMNVIGYAIDTTGHTFADAVNTFMPECPFSSTVTLTVNGESSSATVNFVDPVPTPEPGTLALGFLGAIFIIVNRRWKILRGT